MGLLMFDTANDEKLGCCGYTYTHLSECNGGSALESTAEGSAECCSPYFGTGNALLLSPGMRGGPS